MDHDLLIKLDTKFDQMSQDIKSLADGTTSKLTDHETRITSIERLRDQIDPISLVKKVNVLAQEKLDHDKNKKYLYTVLVMAGAVISWLISNVPHIIGYFMGR